MSIADDFCLYFIFLAPRKGREGYPMRHARRCTQRIYSRIGQLPYSHRVFGLIRNYFAINFIVNKKALTFNCKCLIINKSGKRDSNS